MSAYKKGTGGTWKTPQDPTQRNRLVRKRRRFSEGLARVLWEERFDEYSTTRVYLRECTALGLTCGTRHNCGSLGLPDEPYTPEAFELRMRLTAEAKK